MYDPHRFAEKYQLALQSAAQANPAGGLCGLELEWNLLDNDFRPLLTVGSGPGEKSFVDYLRSDRLAPWFCEFSQLEVFHWMIEWATRPYYHPRGAIFEGRLIEGILMNALSQAGRQFATRLYTWSGNLPILTHVDHSSIPSSWHLAKRNYLKRCVDLYGDSLATTGTHANLSLPDPLFAWDFVHLPRSERIDAVDGALHLDDYKSQFYITAARLLRAFGSLFIATSAATPFQARVKNGFSEVILSEYDSVRNLTFPNPPGLDLPNLYRSYKDYLQISYQLVHSGVRFGNNNWTPTRARSFAEPVERLIAVTSEQLQDLYARGLYALGQENEISSMAHQIEIQNLMARINLPMSRVEVRTDDGGHPIGLEVSNLTLKQLLLLRIYGDPDFARSFRYDSEDIARARRNEDLAAKYGLQAEIEHPLTGKPLGMRDFLSWVLAEVRPLAEALNTWQDLQPLVDQASGDSNTAEKIRRHVQEMLNTTGEEPLVVPLEVLRELSEERENQVASDIEAIAGFGVAFRPDAIKLTEFIQRGRDEARLDSKSSIRFRPAPGALVTIDYPDKTSEILDLAQQLIQIPSVTACPDERLQEVHRAATLIYDYARSQGLEVRYFEQDKYPALIIGLPGQMYAPVMLAGHFDVVAPEPDDSQFQPRIEGDYLVGRGAADMKTVVATYLVWMKDVKNSPLPLPPFNLMLIGNEENGEGEPMGTPHLLRLLADERGYAPGLFIAGERTGERGSETWGEICTQNRGVMRFEVVGRGQRGHSGLGTGVMAPADLTERILLARAGITAIFGRHLTLSSSDGWHSQVKFPFIHVGTRGIFNITADSGLFGVEIRPIPSDNLSVLTAELRQYCESFELELQVSVMEEGIACDPENPHLLDLIEAVRRCSGQEPVIGKKLPGTSARFAPGGQGVVWGQAGIGPHAKNERHFIPSILPYYQALTEYGRLVAGRVVKPGIGLIDKTRPA